MLRSTDLPPGRRALLLPHASSWSPYITNRSVTFTTGERKPPRPFIVNAASKATGPPRSRPPRTWSPGTISRMAGGIILAGLWYIVHEGRSYKVAEKADRYEPRTIGAHREGNMNRDYVSYDHWVETHGLRSKHGHGRGSDHGHERK
ncbi:uncharacterized protein B0T15DRAFT_497121 [Chaetomium strumarium]|uniref:Uncharacterized protein n=1 Tax=Chaetomium strumarium TaxID=1170767 RepID=A0AAJ0GMG3_9PEZI|nr:hypothetical protein B0T15DRAFT_497121 [Chaetomium strumarium]